MAYSMIVHYAGIAFCRQVVQSLDPIIENLRGNTGKVLVVCNHIVGHNEFPTNSITSNAIEKNDFIWTWF